MYIEQYGLELEGIFRISGSQETIRNIKETFEKGKQVDLSKELNPHTVAGVLKLFFTELPNPLFSFELYPAFIEAASFTDLNIRLWCIKQVIESLPPGNRAVLQRVISMFVKISMHSEINKMSPKNIATIMNPALFRDPSDLSISSFMKNGGMHVRLVTLLIAHYQALFEDSREKLDEKIRNGDELTLETEKKLMDFSYTLKQNTILLASGLMDEGETQLTINFDNLNLDAVRHHDDTDDESNDIDDTKEDNNEKESTDEPIKIVSPRVRSNASLRRKKQRKQFRKISHEPTAPLQLVVEKPVIDYSSARLFFDGRETLAIAEEAGIDLSELFLFIIKGDSKSIHEKLQPLPADIRFLLIYRLQRASRDFIVSLDECKYTAEDVKL